MGKKAVLGYNIKVIVYEGDKMHRSEEIISKNMQHIHNKDSKIELILRKELWSRGLIYRKNVTRIIGKPDIAFIGKRVAVFCDSEFWHGYNWEKRKKDFKTHQKFWYEKIERNMERDLEVTIALRDQGWTVLRFWGQDIKHNVTDCADIIERELKNGKKRTGKQFDTRS